MSSIHRVAPKISAEARHFYSGRRGGHLSQHHMTAYTSHHEQKHLPRPSFEAPRRAFVITGATSELSGSLILKGLSNNWTVIACVRDKEKFEKKYPLKHRNLVIVGISTQDALDPEAWKQIGLTAAKTHEFIGYVNTIGGSVAPKGLSLDDINRRPAVAAAKGLRLALNESGAKGSYVSFSSIVATMLPDHEYGASRAIADTQAMEESGVPTSIVRPGLVYPDMVDGNQVNMQHPFSPEQLASLPLKFVIGSGNQPMQPVYEGDVVDAVINSLDASESKIINAVGKEVVTQKELYEFFHDLVNPAKFRHVKVSTKIMHTMARHAPHGRLAPYSVAVFDHLDKKPDDGIFPWQPFAKAIGRKPSHLRQIYHRDVHKQLVMAKAPLTEYTIKVLKSLWAKPRFRKELTQATYETMKAALLGTKD